MKKPTLSVVLATYQEEANLKRCLTSVKDIADEIIIVDGGSSDHTVEIAKQFTNKIIVTDNPPLFHINKQKALDQSTKDWILQLDADEEVSDGLKNEITTILNLKKSKDGYKIPRNNYFTKKLLKKGGMYPDYVVRLFKRGKGYFLCKSVHEQISITGDVGYMKEALDHYPYPTYQSYLRKADAYTSLTANEYKQAVVPLSVLSAFKYQWVRSFKTFVSLYIRHKGFLDGWWGFVWALNSGFHHVWAYKKYKKYKKMMIEKPAKFKITNVLFSLALVFLSSLGLFYSYIYFLPFINPHSSVYNKILNPSESMVDIILPTNQLKARYHRMLSKHYFIRFERFAKLNDFESATIALDNSNENYIKSVLFLIDSRNNHQDISDQTYLLEELSSAHLQVLESILRIIEEDESPVMKEFEFKLLESKAVQNFVSRLN